MCLMIVCLGRVEYVPNRCGVVNRSTTRAILSARYRHERREAVPL
jgi:hypothetical protein